MFDAVEPILAASSTRRSYVGADEQARRLQLVVNALASPLVGYKRESSTESQHLALMLLSLTF